MAMSTGTSTSASDLLNKLSTFMTANGWTKRLGETDLSCAAPKAARYWRLLVIETDYTYYGYKGLDLLEWRTTAGGSNVATDGTKYAFSSLNSGTGADLVSGPTEVWSANIGNNVWWVSYDFGTPTAIAEISIKNANHSSAPAAFFVQWSNDNRNWTTMRYYPFDDTRFTADNQTVVFTWDSGSGYTSPDHANATSPRKGGLSTYMDGGNRSRLNEHNDNIWSWEGLGYDANRRVFISAFTSFDVGTNDEFVTWSASTELDASMPAASWFTSQVGTVPVDPKLLPTHALSTSGVTYWFYLSSKRLIVVTRSGVNDYMASYVGFMSAFAQPDDYPFPLYVGSGVPGIENKSLADNTSGNRSAHDPSNGSAYVRDWDNNWHAVYNHDNGLGYTDEWAANPSAWTWPIYVGVGGRADWPWNVMGDHQNDPKTHWLDHIDPTEQGDLPLFPVTVQNDPRGNLGTLEGLFVVPSGGVLAAESTFTIGADTYRVFTTRAFSSGNHFFAVKEI